MENIKIPMGVSICVDDVGWHEGENRSFYGEPFRSAIPRLHHPDDVLVLQKIAKGLGVKILCDIVLGDWDKNNRLRKAPYLTWGAGEWDMASKIDMDYTEKYFSALEDSENLECGMHTATHGYYVDGKIVSGCCIYPPLKKNERGELVRSPLPTPQLEEVFELFYAIYDDWGFKKKIRTWQTPCGGIGVPDSPYNLEIGRVAHRYGIRVWEWAGWPNIVEVHEGMIYLSAVLGGFLPWNACAVDPSILHNCFEHGPRPGFRPNICGHLTNFIQYQHEKNFDYVPAWIDYFRRVTSPFGVMLAEDNEDSASQALYAELARIDKIDGGYRINLSDIDKIRTETVKDSFFVSIREKNPPKEIVGGRLIEKEKRADHTIYQLIRDGDSPIVTIKM